MKTLPLDELLQQITPLPWRPHDISPRGRRGDHFQVTGPSPATVLAQTSHNPLNSTASERTATAAYLAHAANLLPELVAAMNAYRYRSTGCFCLGVSSHTVQCEKLRSVLDQATAVPVP